MFCGPGTTHHSLLTAISVPGIMTKIEKFGDIEAWQAARELTRQIYKAATHERFARDYGLRDQI